jgi:hypothetical protein
MQHRGSEKITFRPLPSRSSFHKTGFVHFGSSQLLCFRETQSGRGRICFCDEAGGRAQGRRGGANVETLPFSNSIGIDDLFRHAGARADTTCASGWANLRCRSTSWVGAWISAGFTMRLPLGRYGTPIRLCGQDKADRPRCWNNQRGKAVLDRVRAEHARRQKHFER